MSRSGFFTDAGRAEPLREVVARVTWEYVITEGRDAIAVSTQQLTQEITR